MGISKIDYVMWEMNRIYNGMETREVKVHRIFHLLKENESLVRETRSVFHNLQLENMYEGFVHQRLGEYNERLAFKMKVLSQKLSQCMQVINHSIFNDAVTFEYEPYELDPFRI